MIEFKCIADKCKHTCCRGWEIDVDEETYEIYQALPGEFGDRIRASIVTESYDDTRENHNPEAAGKEAVHHFALTEDERCPFLNERNLCDIILNLGEDYLCDICSEHPRFYKEVEDGRFACGYGLCCEEAARLTLFPEYEAENQIPENDEYGIDSEILGNIEDVELQKVIELCKLLASLESIEKRWISSVNKIALCKPKVDIFNGKHNCTICKLNGIMDQFAGAFCNLYRYMIFRYDSEKYATMMCAVILHICDMDKSEKGDFTREDMIEIVRVYSADIEYSDENADIIMNYLNENR